jgi:hypothetical protein
MPLFRFRAFGGSHDSRVVEEDMEARFLREEARGGGLDGVEVGEIEAQEGEFALGCRVLLCDPGYGGVCSVGRARRYVDGAVARVEEASSLPTPAVAPVTM